MLSEGRCVVFFLDLPEGSSCQAREVLYLLGVFDLNDGDTALFSVFNDKIRSTVAAFVVGGDPVARLEKNAAHETVTVLKVRIIVADALQKKG